jgi:toxin FitB
MILVVTNVISEMMGASSHPGVVAWLAFQPGQSVFTTTISQAEILAGLRVCRLASEEMRLRCKL